MKKILINKHRLLDSVRELDPNAYFTDDYSGRGMYGATCFGIVHSLSNLQLGAVIAHLAPLSDKDADHKIEFTKSAVSDSMGLSTVTYFPGWHYDDI